MNVLSLFDGMSCGQIALRELQIPVEKYYASEINKNAIKLTMHNFPDTIQIGDVRDVDVNKLDKIDLLIGGSPCQSFSFSGKRNGMSTKQSERVETLDRYLQLKNDGFEFDGYSYLFWEFVRVLRDIQKLNNNVKYLLENVCMETRWETIITRALGVRPIMIDSALVSAQSRHRLYWSNIHAFNTSMFGNDFSSFIKQPKDKSIYLRDILENDVPEKYYLNEKQTAYICKGLSTATKRKYGLL